MKLAALTLLVSSLISAVALSAEPTVYCKANFKENGKIESKSFIFKCDNYGKKATFTSKSGRFYVSAFSEESCTPQLFAYDNQAKSFTSAIGYKEEGKGFEIFINTLVATTLVADIQNPASVMGNTVANDKVSLGCSTDKELLKMTDLQ